MKRKNKFNFIDLFAGIGGFHIALHEIGGRCVFASEKDKFARLTYEANFKKLSPQLFTSGHFNEDINSEHLEYSEIPDFDILCAGFPCQPFSYSGKNRGFQDKARGTLFFSILKILEAKRPKALFLENVKGLKSHNNGKTLETIIESIRALGYYPKWKILDSLKFGLPQKRERWYCVGFLEETDFEFPEGSEEIVKLSSIVDVNDANEKLRLPPQEVKRIENHFRKAKNGERVRHDNSQYSASSKKGRHGIYSFQKSDGSLRFHVGDIAKTQIQEGFYSCLDTYSSTIIYNRVPKLWDLNRKLSVLECKRLQGFPDDFKFPVSDNQAYRQLGNSVALPVVRAISKEIIKQICKNED